MNLSVITIFFQILFFAEWVPNSGGFRILCYSVSITAAVLNIIFHQGKLCRGFSSSSASRSPENYKFTRFHVKRKGEKLINMEANSEYLTTHCLKKGWFTEVKNDILILDGFLKVQFIMSYHESEQRMIHKVNFFINVTLVRLYAEEGFTRLTGRIKIY